MINIAEKHINCLNKGKIIFLNGVTSTGKTTPSKELQIQSNEQSEMMTKNIKYDISVDTYLNDTEDCAKIILEKVFGK